MNLRIIFEGTCLVLCCLALAACMISRHPVGIATASAPVTPTYTVIGPVEESDCSYHFLFLPLGLRDAPDELIERLVKEKGADALIGVTVEERSALFPLPIMWNTCTIVTGLAVKNTR